MIPELALALLEVELEPDAFVEEGVETMEATEELVAALAEVTELTGATEDTEELVTAFAEAPALDDGLDAVVGVGADVDAEEELDAATAGTAAPAMATR